MLASHFLDLASHLLEVVAKAAELLLQLASEVVELSLLVLPFHFAANMLGLSDEVLRQVVDASAMEAVGSAVHHVGRFVEQSKSMLGLILPFALDRFEAPSHFVRLAFQLLGLFVVLGSAQLLDASFQVPQVFVQLVGRRSVSVALFGVRTLFQLYSQVDDLTFEFLGRLVTPGLNTRFDLLAKFLDTAGDLVAFTFSLVSFLGSVVPPLLDFVGLTEETFGILPMLFGFGPNLIRPRLLSADRCGKGN